METIMASTQISTSPEPQPDQRKITSLQAKRLSALANVNVSDLEGLSIAQASERLKWTIDPWWFLFRKICGKVVKKDPVTGVQYPVPFATVYVEDTDCNFISFFPTANPWSWHFPIFCHREVIATTKTDKCGNFCVWVPRFDIEWILKWREERICFPIIFNRPTVGDLVAKIPNEVVGPWPPVPNPDPGPLQTLTTLPPSAIEAIAGASAAGLAARAVRLQGAQVLGALNRSPADVLHARAFERDLPPPLPAEFHKALSGSNVVAAKGASATDGIRSAIAQKLGLDSSAKELANFDLRRFIGPFWRCYDILVPEWQIILDVPDITFRVGQDVNGDGVEETIYSEGYFDVRWNAGPLPDVTLVASPIAKESRVCNTPVVQCSDVPAILFAGFMPLDLPSYFDGAVTGAPPAPSDIGYTLRPNRPTPDPTGATPLPGRTAPPAQTPFCETLQLYGCVEVKNAQYYRFQQSLDGGQTFSAITGLAWNNYRNTGGAPIPIAADAAGWYEINPHDAATPPVQVARQDLEFPNLLLDWPTPSLGQVVLKLDVGDAAKAIVATSSLVAFQVDNTAPTVTFTQLAWRFIGENDSQLRSLLGIPCPTIHRGTTPQDIELVFEVTVQANHLRDASLGASGCGSGVFAPIADPANKPSHWHTSGSDNNVTLHQRYQLSHTALEGAYSFDCEANSRAMNPSGADGGNLLPTDWNYDPIYIYVIPSIGVAVINGA
jgi:hypothetical protein